MQLTPQEELDSILIEEEQLRQANQAADWRLIARRGIALEKLARYDEALQACDEAEALCRGQGQPVEWTLAKCRALVHLRKNRFEEALAAYDMVDELRREQGLPEDWEVAKNRGNVFFGLNRHLEALAAYERAEQLRREQGLPEYPYLNMNRGGVYDALGRYDDALAAYDEAEKLQLEQGLPVNPSIPTNRGVVYESLRRYADALAAYDEAQRMRRERGMPDSPNLWMNRGVVYGKLGRLDEALAAYSTAEELRSERGQPASWHLLFFRAITLFEAGRKEQAIEQACAAILACGQLKINLPGFVTETLRDWLNPRPENVGAAEPSAMPPPPLQPATDAEKKYDAFICYRRAAALGHAMLLKTHLDLNHKVVFRDQDDLAKGNYQANLEAAVLGARHLIVLLTPDFFVKCSSNEDDDVRREIRTALRGGTQVIPVMMEGFHWPAPESLPEDIRPICHINGMSFSSEFFPAFMDKLLRWMS